MMIKWQKREKKMRNKLIDGMTDIGTMVVAGLSTFAKIKEMSDLELRRFIQNWGDQLEVNLTKLRELLDED